MILYESSCSKLYSIQNFPLLLTVIHRISSSVYFFASIFFAVTYLWFWLLGLSGMVIFRNPLSSKGRKYLLVNPFVFLYPQYSTISFLSVAPCRNPISYQQVAHGSSHGSPLGSPLGSPSDDTIFSAKQVHGILLLLGRTSSRTGTSPRRRAGGCLRQFLCKGDSFVYIIYTHRWKR